MEVRRGGTSRCEGVQSSGSFKSNFHQDERTGGLCQYPTEDVRPVGKE